MAYLLVHFTGEDENGEQIYFSVSKDGLHWMDLGSGPALVSDIGEKGVRDPFLVRNCLNGKFYLMATDLRIANQKGWDTAQYKGSLNLILWESDTLTGWGSPYAVDFPEIRKLQGGCVWAPEAFFDRTKEAYLVYWASMVNGKQRIYAAYTRDFHDFTDFHPFIERKEHIIDTTIVGENGRIYRFSAEEFCGGITLEVGSGLHAADYHYICKGHLPGLKGMEGPVIFYRKEEGQWCLCADDIGNGAGYVPFLSKELSSGTFTQVPSDSFNMGKRRKRHGSILSISETEYEELVNFYGIWGK